MKIDHQLCRVTKDEGDGTDLLRMLPLSVELNNLRVDLDLFSRCFYCQT